jgi:riboflavin kinase
MKTRICSFQGRVVRGRQVGRTIGFPTANLLVEELNRPLANGVYGVIVEYGGNAYIGVMNKGVRPTLADREPQVHYEVHILDFSQDIYHDTIAVHVCFFVRPEQRFDSLNQLCRQIVRDVEEVKETFSLRDEFELRPSANVVYPHEASAESKNH